MLISRQLLLLYALGAANGAPSAARTGEQQLEPRFLRPRQSPDQSAKPPSNPFEGIPNIGTYIEGYKTLITPRRTAKTIQLKPKLRNDAKRVLHTWGPYKFLPSELAKSNLNTVSGPPVPGMDPSGQMIWNSLKGICTNCTVLHGSTYLARADGSRVDLNRGAYLHHSLIAARARTERPFFACSKDASPPARPEAPASFFLGSGVDSSEFYFTSQDGKYNSGYYIPSNSGFEVQLEAINFNKAPMEWYIAAEVEYIEGKPSGLEVVTVTDINVNTCNSLSATESVYHAPKGASKFNMTSPKFIMDRDLVMLQAVGHVHEGGVKIILSLNDKVVCESVAEYGGEQGTFNREDGWKWTGISRMTPCFEPVQIKKGDVMTMVSIYDTDLHPVRESNGGGHGHGGGEMEEMGVFTVFFAEKN